jgi:hypothetical protein
MLSIVLLRCHRRYGGTTACSPPLPGHVPPPDSCKHAVKSVQIIVTQCRANVNKPVHLEGADLGIPDYRRPAHRVGTAGCEPATPASTSRWSWRSSATRRSA